MATYEQDPITEAKKCAAQQAVDMHAGNEQQPEPVRQPTEQIDWEKHRQFMRGLG
ncbi:hypothetical protein [Ralstonia chuxiongensis]|uniref:Uncharacterized protein n=1 Tax=Ralstonia chuxiongensis TaxID=2957504 RepID=A0AA41WWS5_9RALS|nr:hypothetical protein [Ralstonia chuxiongensis]MCP1173779.1 hypothetical protein [Ralstonia chuxiongensis]